MGAGVLILLVADMVSSSLLSFVVIYELRLEILEVGTGDGE